MKSFLKNFFIAIPLAIGVVLTVMSISNAMEAPDSGDKGVLALICGVIGIPLMFATIASLVRNPNA
jgi:hypothetical protein